MGADLPRRNGGAPTFFVQAFKDAGSAGLPGTDLQRVQIIKGWVDAQGSKHERVYEVAGDANGGAGVDPTTCEPVGAGHGELCTVWTDPDFDAAAPAFYYARVLENPTCRWSSFACIRLGVDPFADDCEAQGVPECCLDARNDPFVEPTIQERAWTSPIWYRPSGGGSSGDATCVRGRLGTGTRASGTRRPYAPCDRELGRRKG